MEFRDMACRFPYSRKLMEFSRMARDRYFQCRETLAVCSEKFSRNPAAQWFHENRNRIAMILHMTWLLGCCLWFYEVIVCDVRPRTDIGLALSDSRDAMVILFFGTLAFFFAIFFVSFVVRFCYNLFRDGVASLFPRKWHSVARPVSYLIILHFAFSLTGTVKMAGLTAYYQVSTLVHTSQQQTLIIRTEIPDDIEEKITRLLELVRDENSR